MKTKSRSLDLTKSKKPPIRRGKGNREFSDVRTGLRTFATVTRRDFESGSIGSCDR